MFRSIRIVILFMCTLLHSAYSSPLPQVKTGLYLVKAINTDETIHSIPFGSMLYLYNKFYAREANSQSVRGIQGVSINYGRVETRSDDSSEIKLVWFWKNSSENGEGEIKIKRIHHDSNTIDIEVTQFNSSVSVEYKLVYYQKKLTSFRLPLIAHRGGGYLPNKFNHYGTYPTNTIEAFKDALRAGYEGIELDVRISQDKKAIVAHDDGLGHISNCSGSISEKTKDEITECSLFGSSVIPEFSVSHSRLQAKIPSLNRVLRFLLPKRDLKKVVLDVKPNTTSTLVEVFQQELNQVPERFHSKIIFLSDSIDFISQMRPQYPNITFAIERSEINTTLRHMDNTIFNNFLREETFQGFNMISINIGVNFGPFQLVPRVHHLRRLVNYSHHYGTQVIGWTVNTIPRIKRIMRRVPNLDYLITDLPIDSIVKIQFDTIRNEMHETPAEIEARHLEAVVIGPVQFQRNLPPSYINQF